MKLKNNLDVLLNQGSKVKILRFLFAESDEHTGRGIASSINMSASATYRLLQELRKAGVISARRKGRAILYKLKIENYFIKKLLCPLFEKEKAVFNDVISRIKRSLMPVKKDVISVALFGSVAGDRETERSDIDLVIVVNDSKGKRTVSERLDSLSVDMAQEFGVGISPYLLTRQEIIKRYNRKQPVILSIMNSNKLIYGEPIERILA